MRTDYYSSATMALLGVGVLGLLTEVLLVAIADVYVAVRRSDISFSAVTFRTRKVLMVPRSALRRSFIS